QPNQTRASAPSDALPEVPRPPVSPPTPSPVQPTSAGGGAPSPCLRARCLQPSSPTPAALPHHIATISNIVRSSFPTFPTYVRLSSRPAALRTTVLTDVAVSSSLAFARCLQGKRLGFRLRPPDRKPSVPLADVTI
ncbi:hypothetical protein THAOC_16237, partial [Thalassiosira oceanica]